MNSTKTGRTQSKVPNISNTPKPDTLKLMDLPTEGIIMENEYLGNIKIMANNDEQFKKAHEYDAGYDILAAHTGTVPANSNNLIGTELFIQVPKGYVGIIKSRSGLSVKHGIDVGAGVIDCGYTGEVKVLLRNTSDKWFDYNAGDRIAQMIIIPVCPFKVVKETDFTVTARGSKGFGSTGR